MKNPISRWLNRSKTAGYAGMTIEKWMSASGKDLPENIKNHFMDEILKYKELIDECYNSYDGSNEEALLLAGSIRGVTGILFAAQYVDKSDVLGRYAISLAKIFIVTISELKNDDKEGWVVPDFSRQYLTLAEQALLVVDTLDY